MSGLLGKRWQHRVDKRNYVFNEIFVTAEYETTCLTSIRGAKRIDCKFVVMVVREVVLSS